MFCFLILKGVTLPPAEAIFRRCSVKKVFLEMSQDSQENNCAREVFNKVPGITFFYRTPPVATSAPSRRNETTLSLNVMTQNQSPMKVKAQQDRS